MRTALLFVFAVFLGLSSLQAEPDAVARMLLGVGSLPVQFTPTKEGKVYQLAVAKFKDGKFLGYCQIPSGIVSFQKTADHPAFEAEFAWAKRDGQSGFVLVTPSWSQNFTPDAFFDGPLAMTRYFAYKRLPEVELGPFFVLGVAYGGEVSAHPDEENLAEWLKGVPFAAVLLLAPFDTGGQAEAFAKSMPSPIAE